MATLELLDALDTGADTVATVARALGIPREESARQLSAATASGLLIWTDEHGRFTEVDAASRFVHLSTAGLIELDQLRKAAADR